MEFYWAQQFNYFRIWTCNLEFRKIVIKASVTSLTAFSGKNSIVWHFFLLKFHFSLLRYRLYEKMNEFEKNNHKKMLWIRKKWLKDTEFLRKKNSNKRILSWESDFFLVHIFFNCTTKPNSKNWSKKKGFVAIYHGQEISHNIFSFPVKKNSVIIILWCYWWHKEEP